MSERLHNDEAVMAEYRLEYGAVPLDPWHTHNIEDAYEPYVAASIERIRQRTVKAMRAAKERGWIDFDEMEPDGDLARALEFTDEPENELAANIHKIIELSLYDSQMMRVNRNHKMRFDEREGNVLDASVDKSDPRILRAMAGTASPEDLLSALIDYPTLGSIELAKLSHPLDGTITKEMDSAVLAASGDYLNIIKDATPHYKTKSHVVDLPAATVLRKLPVASLMTPYGELQVVQRRAFLVRGDEAVIGADIDMPRKVKNISRHAEELYPKIDGYLRYADAIPNPDWLQPLATSYYAYYDQPKSLASE